VVQEGNRFAIDTRGEELLHYPLMTLMTQIFLGCVIRGNQWRRGENPQR